MSRISFPGPVISRWISSTVLIFIITSCAFSQQKKFDTVAIRTSAVCGMCKERLETGLSFEKGVKSVTLDMRTRVMEIVYNPVKTTPEKLRMTISKLGYDADTIQADKKAYANLPACCKKDAPAL